MNVKEEVQIMLRLPIALLRARYVEVIGEAPRSSNRVQLVRRIAWRMQAKAEGDLSERARQRAEELADDSDLRIRPPHIQHKELSFVPGLPITGASVPGLPAPGSFLTRTYRGRCIAVKVLAKGFEYDGARYRSLSAIAKAITGCHWNGRLFFGLRPTAARVGAAESEVANEV